MTQEWSLDATAHGIYAEPQEKLAAKRNPNLNARGSLGFQFDTPDSMLGAVLKYKDLKEVVVGEMGVIELEFYHGLLHVTLRLTVPSSEARDQLLENIKEYSLGKAWVHGYDATAMGAIQHFMHTMKDKDTGILGKACAVPEFVIDFLLKGTLFACAVPEFVIDF